MNDYERSEKILAMLGHTPESYVSMVHEAEDWLRGVPARPTSKPSIEGAETVSSSTTWVIRKQTHAWLAADDEVTYDKSKAFRHGTRESAATLMAKLSEPDRWHACGLAAAYIVERPAVLYARLSGAFVESIDAGEHFADYRAANSRLNELCNVGAVNGYCEEVDVVAADAEIAYTDGEDHDWVVRKNDADEWMAADGPRLFIVMDQSKAKRFQTRDEADAFVLDHEVVGWSPTVWLSSPASEIEERAPERVREWRCFHCDETFYSEKAAAGHFGDAEYDVPACLEMLSKSAKDIVEESHTMRRRALVAEDEADQARYLMTLVEDQLKDRFGVDSISKAAQVFDALEGQKVSLEERLKGQAETIESCQESREKVGLQRNQLQAELTQADGVLFGFPAASCQARLDEIARLIAAAESVAGLNQRIQVLEERVKSVDGFYENHYRDVDFALGLAGHGPQVRLDAVNKFVAEARSAADLQARIGSLVIEIGDKDAEIDALKNAVASIFDAKTELFNRLQDVDQTLRIANSDHEFRLEAIDRLVTSLKNEKQLRATAENTVAKLENTVDARDSEIRTARIDAAKSAAVLAEVKNAFETLARVLPPAMKSADD